MSFVRADAEDDSSQFIESFDKISKEIGPLLELGRQRAGMHAPGFNLFSILKAGTDEDKTHTPLLAELLNPEGSHEQGVLFLDAFLSRCRGKPGFVSPQGCTEDSKWVVQTQRFTPFGVIDLVLLAPRLRYMLVVENKILAGEQDQQVDRYYRWMQTQKDCYPNQALVFLTPDGRASTTCGEAKYSRMAYCSEMADVLTGCIEKVAAERVRGVLRQYIDLIKNICGAGGPSMGSQSDDEVMEFLLRRDNLQVALAIREKLGSATNCLLDRLWGAVFEMTASRVRAVVSEGTWRVEAVRSDYGFSAGTAILQADRNEGLFEYACTETDELPSGVSQGILYTDSAVVGLEKELARLRTRLIDDGFDRGGKGCLVAKVVMQYSSGDHFMLAVADNVHKTAEVISRTLCDFFEATCTEVSALNARLLEGRRTDRGSTASSLHSRRGKAQLEP